MILTLFLILAILAFIIFVIISVIVDKVHPSRPNIQSSHSAEQDDHEKMFGDGTLPDWEDLSDEEKTRVSVWSEKGEPLEDLHLFENK